MNKKPQTKPKQHSRRVAAWVYTVINPIVDALDREIQFLEKGSLTWRHYSQRCEYIRPTQEYVQTGHWPNYHDFLAENLAFHSAFEKHDRTLTAAESVASKFYEILINAPIYQKDIHRYLEEYEATLDPPKPGHHSLDYMKEDLPKYIAEYLINEIKVLPSHYTIHKFWERYCGQFWKIYSTEFQAYKGRQSFRSLSSAKQELAQVSAKLKTHLEEHRLALCRKFDIPAAPIALTVDVGSAL